MSSTKPYLLRAIYDWAEDNNLTPQVLVNATEAGVEVPAEHVVDGQIILNISSTAVLMQQMDNEFIRFSARFNGNERNISLPIASILAIFARENSQGIFFEENGDDEFDPDATPPQPKNKSKRSSEPASIGAKAKSNHLKIIK